MSATQSIEGFANVSVLVVGDLMLDRYWHGYSDRISPEAPVPVVRVDRSEERAGAAANVALNVSALGAKANLLGAVGRDAHADTLLNILKKGGVGCAGVVKVPDRQTVVKHRVMSRNQQLLRMDFEDGAPLKSTVFKRNEIKRHIEGSDVVIISDYGKLGLPDAGEIIALAKAANIPVLVDPKGEDYSIYRGATMLTPNAREFEVAFGQSASDSEAIVNCGQKQMERLALKSMLVTRGAQGMTLLQKGGKPMHLAAEELEVYDVTGAGDTVIATLAPAIGAGMSVEEAVRLSNIAAAISIGRIGTVAVTAAELKARLQSRGLSSGDGSSGVASQAQLLKLVEAARARGKRVVFTNGCFDILHLGHVSMLQQAAALGDYLIVAVNSDASVRRLKGAARPINDLASRMGVLAALGCVDWVVDFAQDTPEKILTAVKPDILVKGGDYTRSQVVCGDLVERYGGEVRVLDKVDSVSTSETIDKVLSKR